MREHDERKSYWWLTLTASLGLFNFGYNTSSIAGALLYIEPADGLPYGQNCVDQSVCLRSSMEKGYVVASCLFGAMIGALVAGSFAELVGPRTALLFNNVPYLVGAIGMAIAPNIWVLICSRAVAGLGVGVSSALVTVYVSEIVPASRRGEYGVITSTMVTIGVLVAFIASCALAESWRVLLGLAAVPSVLQLMLGPWIMPESPKWLQKRQLEQPGKQVALLEADAGIRNAEVKPGSSSGWATLLAATRTKTTVRPLVVGIGMQFFQQTCGINVTVYFSPQVFRMLQCSELVSDALSALITFLSIVSSLIISKYIDVIGRRQSGFIGISTMALSFLAVAGAFLIPQEIVKGWLIFLAILIYRVAFGISLGPLPFVVTAEIFPDSYRAAGASVSWACNWASNFLVSLTFLQLVEVVGASATFSIYALLCFFALWFLYACVPETSGQELATD